MPTSTVPTAPIPVQTAYTFPIGRLCVTYVNNDMLAIRQTAKEVYQMYAFLCVDSWALPSEKVKPTSSNPAIINKNQFIFYLTYFNHSDKVR